MKKVCTLCELEKDLEYFSKDKRGKFGKSSRCKSCKSSIDFEYRETHKEQLKARSKRYYDATREERIRSAVQWKKDNPEKGRAHSAKYRENNREKDRASKLAYYYRNPQYINEWNKQNPHKRQEYWQRRRARELSVDVGDVTAEAFTELCAKYNNKCLCCGRSDLKLTLDHIFPLSQGGTHSMDNIQPLCKHCNNKKYTSTIDYRPDVVWLQL